MNKNCSNAESKDILFGIAVLRKREKRQFNSEIPHTTIIKHNLDLNKITETAHLLVVSREALTNNHTNQFYCLTL